MKSDVAVVILAGGEGKRIGGGKPLRKLAGERLIDRAVRQAAQWSDLVVISVRHPAQVQPIDSTLLMDEPHIGGPLGGLVSALRFAEVNGRRFALTVAADTPLLPVDLFDRLSSIIGTGECALASSGGRLHPVCGLWRTTALCEIDRYLGRGRRSLGGFAEMVGFKTANWLTEPVDPFFNVNTADDLGEAEKLA